MTSKDDIAVLPDQNIHNDALDFRLFTGLFSVYRSVILLGNFEIRIITI